MKLIDRKKPRRDMTSKLYDCEFHIKVVKFKILKCSSSLVDTILYIYRKHSGHNPKSNADFFFLSVHPYVIVWILEKFIIHVFTVNRRNDIREGARLVFRKGDGLRPYYK